MSNTTPKWFVFSRTIVASLVALLTALLPALGVSFGPDDAALINELWDKVIIAVSAALAILGRFKADKPVTFKPGA